MGIPRLSLAAAALFIIACLGSVGLSTACRPRSSEALTIYASQDQVYAEPLLREFSKQTGIPVQAIYDSEAVKTVGLANRLLAERERPLADAFWSNEEFRTRQLAAAGVFRPTNGWISFGQRARRWVVNTQVVAAPLTLVPARLLEITNRQWRGKVALASPLFGSTSTHFCVLRQRWGEAAWNEWCAALMRNEPILTEGNSMVVRMVARGQALIGMTDSDDIAAGQREGWPVMGFSIGPDGWQMPNTVGIIQGARQPRHAERLMSYLQSTEALQRLRAAAALDPESPPDPSQPPPDWDRLLRELPQTTDALRRIFLR